MHQVHRWLRCISATRGLINTVHVRRTRRHAESRFSHGSDRFFFFLPFSKAVDLCMVSCELVGDTFRVLEQLPD